MTTTKNEAVKALLTIWRSRLGMGEDPPGSNYNPIVKWYNKNVEAIGNGPWCEMSHAWAIATALFDELQKPRAYTPWAAGDAQKGVKGTSWHWGTKGMMVGDKVYYDWQNGVRNAANVDHTGIVERVYGDGTFDCLEGNTGSAGGGHLMRQHRDSKYVMGYVRYDWDRVLDNPSPAPHPIPSDKPEHLDVDGVLGSHTIKAWQRIMKTPVDGKIDEKSSNLVVAVQRFLKVKVNHRLEVTGEGIWQNGHRSVTIGALQKYLGSPIDERIDVPVSLVIKALQRRLNTGKF